MAQSVKLSNGDYIDASAVYDNGSSSDVQTALAALRTNLATLSAGKQDFIAYNGNTGSTFTLRITSNHNAWLVVDYEFGSGGYAGKACICIITTSYSSVGYLLDIAGTAAATTGISISTANSVITVTLKGYHTGRVFPIR